MRESIDPKGNYIVVGCIELNRTPFIHSSEQQSTMNSVEDCREVCMEKEILKVSMTEAC